MGKAIASLTQAGRSVVVVAPSSATLEELARLLALHHPARRTDLFGQSALRAVERAQKERRGPGA
jgi:hypothetical protein